MSLEAKKKKKKYIFDAGQSLLTSNLKFVSRRAGLLPVVHFGPLGHRDETQQVAG